MAPNPRIEELRKRLEKDPASRLFAQLAEELRKDGELEEAIRVSREGLQKHPNYPSARMTLGRALMDSGDFAGAAAEFDAVLKAAPDNILASRFLAESFESLGDVARAEAQYRSTLALAPGDKQVTAKLEALQGGRPATSAAPAPAPAPPAPPLRPAPASMATAPPPPTAPPAAPPAVTLPRVSAPAPPSAPRPVAAPPPPPPPVRPEFVAPPAPPAAEPPPIPLVDADEEFELERSYEAPLPAAVPVRSTAEEALAREFERQKAPASAPPPPMPSAPEPVFDETDIAGTTLPPLEASELMAAARKAAEAQRTSRFTELDDEREGEPAPPTPAPPPEPTRRPGLETLFRFSAFDGDTEAGVEEPEVLTPDVQAASLPAPQAPPPPAVTPPPQPPHVAAPPPAPVPEAPPPPRPAPAPVPAPTPPPPPAAAAAVPRVEPPDIISSTMAELYFGQGHIDKAIDVYRKLLRGGPENEKARARLLELETLDRKMREDAAGPSADERRAVLQRQIARLEALLSVIERE